MTREIAITSNKGSISRLTEVAAALPGVIAKLDTAKSDLAQRMAALVRQGLIYATVHMKDGKYDSLLYSIAHPDPAGRFSKCVIRANGGGSPVRTKVRMPPKDGTPCHLGAC